MTPTPITEEGGAIAVTQEVGAEHEGCGGELVLPTIDGKLIEHPLERGKYQVKCRGCRFIGQTNDEELLARARRVTPSARFVIDPRPIRDRYGKQAEKRKAIREENAIAGALAEALTAGGAK